jgi:predicted transcriptional regulator
MNSSDRVMHEVLTNSTPAERAEHMAQQRAQADADDRLGFHLTLSASEVDTLRWLLDSFDADDLSTDTDRDNLRSILRKIGT